MRRSPSRVSPSQSLPHPPARGARCESGGRPCASLTVLGRAAGAAVAALWLVAFAPADAPAPDSQPTAQPPTQPATQPTTVPLPAGPDPARFVGTWTFNPQLTASLRDPGSEGRGGFGGGHRRNGGRGGPGGEDGDGGGGRPGGWGGGDRGDRGEHPGASGEQGARSLRIATGADGALVVDNGRGPSRSFLPGTVKVEELRDGKARVSVSWNEDGNLVVESKPDHGPTRRETFIVDHERKHLYVRISTLGTFSTRSFTAAYDPAEPDAAQVPPA